MDHGEYIRTGMSLTREEADNYCWALDLAQKRYGLSRCEAMEWFFAVGLKCAYDDMGPGKESSRRKAEEIERRIEELESREPTIGKRKTGGFLYFIKAKDNLFKVGITRKSPRRRMLAIQTACPYELELHAALYYENCHKKECEFHSLLAQYKTYGEWFEMDISILDELIIREFVNSHVLDANSLMDATMPFYIMREANHRLAKTGVELFHGGWPWDENAPRGADIERTQQPQRSER